MIKPPGLIQLAQYIDSRGVLIFGESGEEIPFTVQRVFWMVHTPPTVTRGGHAHKECHQFIVALKGSVRIQNGVTDFLLNSPHIGLYVPPQNHITLFNFTDGAAILVLCSHKYDKDDYLHDPIS